MVKRTLKIATRKSPLALKQTSLVKDYLQKIDKDLKIEILPISTTGDNFLNDRLQDTGGKGLFVKELEEALLDNTADIAVHSMKDVPQVLPWGLKIQAILKREDPRDAFLSVKYSSIKNLPLNASIGTASLRRQAQLLVVRPDLNVRLLRGNIHSRIDKLNKGEYDGIILAVAGLKRMDFYKNITEILDENTFLPACGQGAIGIECRDNDTEVINLLNPINDATTSICVNAERHISAALGGSCRVPLAVYCRPIFADTLLISAKVLSSDGEIVLESAREGNFSDADHLAHEISQELTEQGAKNILNIL